MMQVEFSRMRDPFCTNPLIDQNPMIFILPPGVSYASSPSTDERLQPQEHKTHHRHGEKRQPMMALMPLLRLMTMATMMMLMVMVMVMVTMMVGMMMMMTTTTTRTTICKAGAERLNRNHSQAYAGHKAGRQTGQTG